MHEPSEEAVDIAADTLPSRLVADEHARRAVAKAALTAAYSIDEPRIRAEERERLCNRLADHDPETADWLRSKTEDQNND